MQMQNETVSADYPVAEGGLWKVNITQPSNYFVYGDVLVTAPLYAHPALMYAPIPILLGTMLILHSNYRRKQLSYLEAIQFEQNVGGRWVFLFWAPILATISQAPFYFQSFPWLYSVVIGITVAAVFFSFALAYVKICLSNEGFYVEVPFLNFHKHYKQNQIFGYSINQENKRRLLGFWTIPSVRPKKEDQITISLLDPLSTRIWITSLATRLHSNKIIFRPKSTKEFADAAEKLGIRKKEVAEL